MFGLDLSYRSPLFFSGAQILYMVEISGFFTREMKVNKFAKENEGKICKKFLPCTKFEHLRKIMGTDMTIRVRTFFVLVMCNQIMPISSPC